MTRSPAWQGSPASRSSGPVSTPSASGSSPEQDQLAKLNLTIPEIVSAVQKQNTVNPAGQVGAEPAPKGQEFTYAIKAQGRLVRRPNSSATWSWANPDGSLVRLKDVGHVERGDPDLLHDRQAQRQALGCYRRLPAAQHQCHRSSGRGEKTDGVCQTILSSGPGLHGVPGYHPVGARGFERDPQDTVRSHDPGHHRGLRLSPGMAGHPYPRLWPFRSRSLPPLPCSRSLVSTSIPLRSWGWC